MVYGYRWQPLRLPELAPIPLRHPSTLELTEPLVLNGEEAAFLSLGLGRVDMDIRWCWHWSEQGVLSLFRSWTGWEIFRLQLQPIAMVPGSGWRVIGVECDRERLTGCDPVAMLRRCLGGALALRGQLEGVPVDRAAALAAGGLDAPAPPHQPELITQAIEGLLHRHLGRLALGGQLVPIPPDLTMAEIVVDADCIVLTFEDQSRLWLQQPRVTADPVGITATVSGALLWPAAGWPLPEQLAGWALTAAAGGAEHELLAWDTEPIVAPEFPPIENAASTVLLCLSP